jgi:hypothetical protein
VDDTLIDPTGGERTAALVPGARLVLVEDMGHDRPHALWPHLVDAISEHIKGPLLGKDVSIRSDGACAYRLTRFWLFAGPQLADQIRSTSACEQATGTQTVCRTKMSQIRSSAPSELLSARQLLCIALHPDAS